MKNVSFGAQCVRKEFAQASAHFSGIARDGIGGEQRVYYGFLGRFRAGAESKIEPFLAQNANRLKRGCIGRDVVGRGEADKHVAAAVSPDGATASKADTGTLDNTPKLAA